MTGEAGTEGASGRPRPGKSGGPALVRRADGILPYPMRTAFFVGADIIRPQTFRVSPVILNVPRHPERPLWHPERPPCVILSAAKDPFPRPTAYRRRRADGFFGSASE